jgi:hypothetical protein
MKSSQVLVLSTSGGTIIAALTLSSMSGAIEDSIPGKTSSRPIEEICVARSFRESREMPSEFCSKLRTGVDEAKSEDHYTFRSISIRASDGKMINNNVRAIGRLRACFGSTNEPTLQNFYARRLSWSRNFFGQG